MIEYFHYWFMQSIGYRKIYFDAAFTRGIPLSGYSGWFFYPSWKKGTYREINLKDVYHYKDAYHYAGYGTDK